jgi:hypothetical protein
MLAQKLAELDARAAAVALGHQEAEYAPRAERPHGERRGRAAVDAAADADDHAPSQQRLGDDLAQIRADLVGFLREVDG